MNNPMFPQVILGILSFVLLIVEYYHAKEEKRDAFIDHPDRKFTGMDFSERVEKIQTKVQVAFLTFKGMMLVMSFMVMLFAFPWIETKILAYAMVGIYLFYQWHHLIEWYIHKHDNHGRKTAWAYVPLAVCWWLMIALLILAIYWYTKFVLDNLLDYRLRTSIEVV